MEWETIVNQNAKAKKHNKRYTRRKKYLHQIIISCAVGLAFSLATVADLVHPVLCFVGLAVSSWIAFFNLGRVKESA